MESRPSVQRPSAAQRPSGQEQRPLERRRTASPALVTDGSKTEANVDMKGSKVEAKADAKVDVKAKSEAVAKQGARSEGGVEEKVKVEDAKVLELLHTRAPLLSRTRHATTQHSLSAQPTHV